jgi:hypothetical protein
MKIRKPAWWQLYLLFPVMLVLIAIESLKPLPGMSNDIVDAGIVVLFFVAVLGWIHINGGLLERYYMEQDGNYDLKITVYEPASKPKDNGNDGHDLTRYEMPDSGTFFHGRQNITLKEREKWSRN